MTRIEGDIRTRISSYLYASDIPPGGRAGLGSDSRWDVPCGVRPARDSGRLQHRRQPGCDRGDCLPASAPTTRQDASLLAARHDPDLDLTLGPMQGICYTALIADPAHAPDGPSCSWFSSRNAQSPPVTPPSSSSLSMINVAFPASAHRHDWASPRRSR